MVPALLGADHICQGGQGRDAPVVFGKSAEEIVIEAINEHLERLNDQRLEAEIQSFKKMYPELRKDYLGQFVAPFQPFPTTYSGGVVHGVRRFGFRVLGCRSGAQPIS